MKVVFTSQEHVSAAAHILHLAYYSSLASAQKELIKKIKTKEYLVALEKNKVIGVLNYTKNYSHYANYIEDICVSQAHRKKGVAKILLQKYISLSKKQTPQKQKYALSSTDVSNTISLAMHRSFGFKEIGRIKALHYGKDEIIFGYDLR